MSKRAVLYARVSGDDRKKEGRNLEGQISLCKQYATKNGWQIVSELAEDDRGASGASFELPMLSQVREMARNRQFEILVVREIDRLSRKLSKQLRVEEELILNGVKIEYVLGDYPDTPEGRFMKHVRATVAELEREKSVERMVRGRRLKVKSGSVLSCGRIAYGYKPLEHNRQTTLEIIESEAAVVKMIFRWYTKGTDTEGPLSMRAIARRLTELGVPTYADLHPGTTYSKVSHGRWNPQSIRRMLVNKTYAGFWTYGKTSDLETLTVEVPAIVDLEIWEMAQTRRGKNKQRAKRNRKHNYLLTSHMRCNRCNSPMLGGTFYPEGKQYQYYTCSVRRTPKDYEYRCDLPSFRVEYVDDCVWRWVHSIMFDPDKFDKGWEAYQVEQTQANVPIQEKLNVVNNLLADYETQYQRLIDLYLSDEFPREMLADRKTNLETTIAALRVDQQELEGQLQANLMTYEELLELKESMAEMAEEVMDGRDSYEVKRQILDYLSVEVRGDVEDGEKVLYARCVLTGKNFVAVSTAISG
ncbi:MAG: recombinase family protein [Ardenticatenaceae bacterium]|nr:recombinase family protein [Ardenticatenaceae bacterium]MCB9005209.1 recombinase family protein [Ardenticatenaceae bacterium]